jgi:phosphoketolase
MCPHQSKPACAWLQGRGHDYNTLDMRAQNDLDRFHLVIDVVDLTMQPLNKRPRLIRLFGASSAKYAE